MSNSLLTDSYICGISVHVKSNYHQGHDFKLQNLFIFIAGPLMKDQKELLN